MPLLIQLQIQAIMQIVEVEAVVVEAVVLEAEAVVLEAEAVVLEAGTVEAAVIMEVMV
jgi:ribosomal protein L5